MKQFNFPLYFLVDTEGSTENERNLFFKWINKFTEETNLRKPNETAFSGGNRFYGLVNVQAKQGINAGDCKRTRANQSFHQTSYLITSAGVMSGSDLYDYNYWGVFNNPGCIGSEKTFFFTNLDDYEETQNYKHIDDRFIVSVKWVIDNVIGKTAQALTVDDDGNLSVVELERNRVVEVSYISNELAEDIEGVLPKVTEFYLANKYILVDTKAAKAFQFGYGLKCEKIVTTADGYDYSQREFDNAVADGDLVHVDEYYIVNCYANTDDKVNYIRSENALEVIINDDFNTTFVPSNHSSVRHSRRHNKWFVNIGVASSCGYEYCEYTSDYVLEDEVREQPNCGYHDGERPTFKCNNTQAKFMIGFEIEKDENEETYNIGWKKVWERTKWLKEDDGSLDDYGYELVTPVYDLFDSKLEEDLQDDDIARLVNSGYYSSCCGGHINLSSSIYSPAQMLNGIKAFIPLLYSMYNFRMENEYCTPKKHKYLAIENEKYSSIHFKGNRDVCSIHSVMEIRIVSAVRNCENLIWRRDLLRIIMENINRSERDVLRMLTNDRSRLFKHLSKVYSDRDMIRKANQYVELAEAWNDIKLPPIDWDAINKAKARRKKNKDNNNNTDNNNLSA
jgi:hypothetical protein